MNPLAAYLLSALKREQSNDTRAFLEYEAALAELGYWILERPIWCARKDMPPCRISEECRFLEEFKQYNPPFAGLDGFDIMVEVYADE